MAELLHSQLCRVDSRPGSRPPQRLCSASLCLLWCSTIHKLSLGTFPSPRATDFTWKDLLLSSGFPAARVVGKIDPKRCIQYEKLRFWFMCLPWKQQIGNKNPPTTSITVVNTMKKYEFYVLYEFKKQSFQKTNLFFFRIPHYRD